MKKILLLISLSSLAACSATDGGMKFDNKGPRGIFISNITKADRVKAYRIAEKHCAKYSKVPRVVNTLNYELENDSATAMRTASYECVRPSN